MGSWRVRLVVGMPLAVVALAWQFHQKRETSAEIKAKMMAICGENAACVAAVNEHGDTCFEEHYRMQRRRTGLDTDQFVACVNDRSGSHFFASKDAE